MCIVQLYVSEHIRPVPAILLHKSVLDFFMLVNVL